MTDGQDRRGFLSGGDFARAWRNMRESFDQAVDRLEQTLSEPIVTIRRDAMACMFEIQFGALEIDRRPAIEGFDFIDQLEAQMTVYRPDSELSQLNAKAFAEPVVVEERLFEFLVLCKQWWSESAGALDISAGPLLRAWGIFERQGRVPADDEIKTLLEHVGMQHVIFSPGERTVRFERSGAELNLGSVGKGYALDRWAERLDQVKFGPSLLSAGHSSLRARGKPTWDDGWRVDIADPRSPKAIAAVMLVNQSLSTSANTENMFRVGEKKIGHLLDPRTGRPAREVLQVTVVAPEAARAEALSTAFFVNGISWTKNYVDQHPEIGTFIVPAVVGTKPLCWGAIKLA